MMRDNIISELHIVTNQISNLIDTPMERNFERLARMAKRMFDLPVVAISLYDEKRQLVKPVVALDVSKMSSFLPFFNEYNTDDILVVEDTLKNDRFKNHELVVHDPKVRFFVSCPIFEKHGKKVGSMIMLDYRPRTFGLTDLSNLNDIIKLVEAEISDFRLSKAQKLLLQEITDKDKSKYIDAQTRAWNFEAFKKILQFQINESIKDKTTFAVASVDLDNLRKINTKFCVEVGDEILTLTSRTVLRSCRDEDTIARGSEEDFMVIIHARDPEHVKTVVNRIKDNISKEYIKLPEQNLGFTVTIGVTMFQEGDTIESVLQRTGLALLKGKRLGRNQIVFN